MAITKIPGVYYNETVDFELTGAGAKIPVFIGTTGNEGTAAYKVDGTVIRKYKNWNDVNKATTADEPGIGVYTDDTTNLLSKTLKDFFAEAEMKNNDDIGVPYIYVIDVGAGTSKDVWLTALTTAKTKSDAIIEIYVGAEAITDTGYTLVSFLTAAEASIQTETSDLDLKTGFTTKQGATDAQLIALTDATNGIQKSRIGIAEPLLFGKTMARICCTPYNIEPGFLEYRTVSPGTFTLRTKTQELALQNAGIIFNHDEVINDKKYCKINLSTSTAFASTTRPADALFHARFNTDNLLRRIFEAVYPQIKANESATNIVKCQTRVDAVVDDEVNAENMIPFNKDTGEGTKLIVSESDSSPYDMVVSGQAQPINCTAAIEVQVKILNPTMKAAQN